MSVCSDGHRIVLTVSLEKKQALGGEVTSPST